MALQMAPTHARWTLAELDRLPDDGNRYEVVRGELFVTPAPSYAHESIASELHEILQPYVRAHGLGKIQRPRAVFRYSGSEVEPDLIVRPAAGRLPRSWQLAPKPLLIVEVLSGSTRRRDHIQKRTFYMDAGIPWYWIVDGEERTVRVVQPDADDLVVSDRFEWQPVDGAEPLTVDVRALFREALGDDVAGTVPEADD